MLRACYTGFLVCLGMIGGLLTQQYLAVNDELEATQSNSAIRKFHEELFCDVVSTRFLLTAVLTWAKHFMQQCCVSSSSFKFQVYSKMLT